MPNTRSEPPHSAPRSPTSAARRCARRCGSSPRSRSLAAVALFVLTYSLDRAAYRGDLTFPGWVNNGSADAARQILTGIAAAVITVVGLVFSILIVALTLASTQFGPRMLRNFIRDRGVQITLGTFVATFFYAVLTLGAVSHGGPRRLRPPPLDHCRARADARRPRRARVLHQSRREVDPAPRSHRRNRADLSNAITVGIRRQRQPTRRDLVGRRRLPELPRHRRRRGVRRRPGLSAVRSLRDASSTSRRTRTP